MYFILFEYFCYFKKIHTDNVIIIPFYVLHILFVCFCMLMLCIESVICHVLIILDLRVKQKEQIILLSKAKLYKF